MFCIHCGDSLDVGHKFCVKCGKASNLEASATTTVVNFDEKWWLRIVKVIYIFLYIPLPFVIWGVWTSNDQTCNYVGSYPNSHYECVSTADSAFWYSLLALVIYLIFLRLAKLTFLYIFFGKKIGWKNELKKLF